ncbi:MAG: IS1 family transposase [Dehalococcoidia bacterium]|nr:MAG: IS1 family transposase [Dehalococcoidia bacterium]
MNKLSIEKKTQVITALVEGNSIRATCRMTGTAKGTVTRLLAEIGKACNDYQLKTMINLNCKKLQCDEIWSFCYAKQKNVPEDKQGKFGYGDVWTFTAIDADTKLVPYWMVGQRDAQNAHDFIWGLKSRLGNRVQLTTDGHKMYLEAVEHVFGSGIDYAQIVKLYGQELEGEKRYSPAQCIGAEKKVIQGNPDIKDVSTSYVERQNLTMRMSMRRFTRLTNAFSKKVESLEYAVALHFMYYNLARPHKTLANPYPRTPAMAAGIANHIWTVEEIVRLTD